MLRLDHQGHMTHTPHPFTEKSIVTDFCENQVEINTDPHPSIEETYKELVETDSYITKNLRKTTKLPGHFLHLH